MDKGLTSHFTGTATICVEWSKKSSEDDRNRRGRSLPTGTFTVIVVGNGNDRRNQPRVTRYSVFFT